jgi:hypothetical protein
MLGRWVERHAGRIVDGKRFVRVGMRQGLVHWRVDVVGALQLAPPSPPEDGDVQYLFGESVEQGQPA